MWDSHRLLWWLMHVQSLWNVGLQVVTLVEHGNRCSYKHSQNDRRYKNSLHYFSSCVLTQVKVVLGDHFPVQVYLPQRTLLRGDHVRHERAEYGEFRSLQRQAKSASHGRNQRSLHPQFSIHRKVWPKAGCHYRLHGQIYPDRVHQEALARANSSLDQGHEDWPEEWNHHHMVIR